MEKEFLCTKTEPSVKTDSGKVRGYRYDGIYTFLGVPYGQAKRFMMPEEPKPWDGYRDTTVPGYNCPALVHSQAVDCFPHNFWLENEDCLNLNVWTDGLGKEDGKPVIVWLHGGGFAYGAPLRQPAYDGASLAKHGQVVVVSVTNRLNIFGHMDLSAYGDKYHNSGNAGIADLVLALKWVQKNIAAFGGDPGNVTICGQSGGGGKVVALMQCPAAERLFQKAVIMSGVGFSSLRANGLSEIAPAMLELMGKPLDDVSPLEQMGTSELIALYKKVLPKLKEKGIVPAFGPINNDYFDGAPCEAYEDFRFGKTARNIPLVIGSTFTEMNLCAQMPDKKDLSNEEIREELQRVFGNDTDYLMDEFKKSYPDKPVIELLHLDAMVRDATYRFLDQRAKSCDADNYSYIITLELPYNGGIPAWHSSDMAYLFHNVEITPVANIAGVSDKIEAQYSGMLLQFAKTGNPSNAAFDQEWQPYTRENPAVMMIDKESSLKMNYDKELVAFLNAHYAELYKQNRLKRPSMKGI